MTAKPYRSLRTLCLILVGFTLLGLILNVGRLATISSILSLLDRVNAHLPVTESVAPTLDQRMRLLTQMIALNGIAEILLFLVWLYHGARNLRPLGTTNLQYTPGFAVGFFFLPLANVVIPYLVLSELWRASSPSDDPLAGGMWQYDPTSPLVAVWWGMRIASVVAIWLFRETVKRGMSLDELIRVEQINMVPPILLVGNALVTMLLVWQITHRQDQKHAAYRAALAVQSLEASC